MSKILDLLFADENRAAARSGTGGLLASLLDADGDGSVWDDVLGMAARGLTR